MAGYDIFSDEKGRYLDVSKMQEDGKGVMILQAPSARSKKFSFPELRVMSSTQIGMLRYINTLKNKVDKQTIDEMIQLTNDFFVLKP